MNRMEYSSSQQTLLEVFEQLSEWRKTRKPLEFKWSRFHLSVIHGYLLKLNLNPDSNLLDQEIFNSAQCPAVYNDTVASFMHALQEVFVVPQQHQLFERDEVVDKRGLIAAFLDVLLRLLHSKLGQVNSVEAGIDCLRKDLRFFLAVLGDESFISNENLLAEFEKVANKVGSLVHLIIFSTKTMEDVHFGALQRRMDHLKAKIIKLLRHQQGITETRMTAAVNSPFIVDSLLDDLDDLLSREDSLVADVKDLIATLQQDLKLFINNPLSKSKEYVMKIIEGAYEAEYLINSFLVEGASCRYFSIGLSHAIRKIKSGIRESDSKLSQLSLQNKSSSDVLKINKSDAVDVFGFEEKESELLQYLKGEENNLQIISICGMPGVGKTTLANKLYCRPSFQDEFDICCWCVVSQRYQLKELLIDILVDLNHEFDKKNMLNIPEARLQLLIYQFLYQRRYLIVMDDLWSSDAWSDLQACFPDNGNKSRIMLTSRNKHVAPRDSKIYELPLMSDGQCWELLRKKVFKDEPCPPHLQKIGEKIATNCHGMPLAVVVIAGVLSSMNNQESTWKKVEGNLASYVLGGENNLMMKTVQLSYDNLMDHLKPCFLYFGVFRQGKKIFVAELLKLWIAEGFICKNDRKSAESVAEEYLKELIDRSLVASVAKTRVDGEIKACVVHDLLHEFCMKRCQEENFQTLVGRNKKHLRLCIGGFENSPRSPLFGLHVRSIFGCYPVSGFLNMKLLRVLVLEGVVSYESLNEIKFVTNLRCLAIGYGSSSSDSEPEKLKLEFISTLVNLEFLQLQSQFYLVYIPSAMAKMKKLRHINVDTQVCFGEECSTSSQQSINNLEFLHKVIIRDLNDENMLKCSPNLRGLKCTCFPFKVEETGTFRYPDFSFFTHLESLTLKGSFANTITDFSLPSNLKVLTLSGLYLSWEKISEIGRLRNLQNLKLLFDAFDGEVWETREGEFEQLRFLLLKSVYDLKEWKVESRHHFLRLRWLMLEDCLHLLEIPAAIGEIATLEVVEIKGHSQVTLRESARQIQEQQREEGNEELNFYVQNNIGPTSQTASSFFSFLLD